MKSLSDTVLCSSSHSHGCPDDAAGAALEGIRSVLATMVTIVYIVCEVFLLYNPKQIAEDMEAMKRRHLEMVHELEESFQVTALENQVRGLRL